MTSETDPPRRAHTVRFFSRLRVTCTHFYNSRSRTSSDKIRKSFKVESLENQICRFERKASIYCMYMLHISQIMPPLFLRIVACHRDFTTGTANRKMVPHETSNTIYRIFRNKRPGRLIFRSNKNIPKPITTHQFCVLPPLKNPS